MTDEQCRDRINELGGYWKVLDAILAAVEPWPNKEHGSGISVSVFKFVEALDEAQGNALSAPSSPGDGWEPRPSTGGQATTIDGKIEISIDVAALPMIVNGSCHCGSMDGLWKVTNAETFAKEVCRALNDEGEDGTTRVRTMFDAAFMEAINQGADGIEEVDEEAFGEEAARLMFKPLPAALNPSPNGGQND